MDYKKLIMTGGAILMVLTGSLALTSCRSEKLPQSEPSHSEELQSDASQGESSSSQENSSSFQGDNNVIDGPAVPQNTAPEESSKPDGTDGAEENRPSGQTPETLEANENPSVPDQEDAGDEKVDYLRYHDMSSEEQKAFVESFSSIDEFFKWHEQAQKEYESTKNDIVVDDDTVIELGG